MVLDRPNPIGDRVAGPMRQVDRSTFVACHHLPVQHGMTVGELALLFAHEGKLDIVPTVMPVRGWKHSDRFESSGQWWLNPSPNMRTLEAARLYPGIGLLEMTNISVGLGPAQIDLSIDRHPMDGRASVIHLAQCTEPAWRDDSPTSKIDPDASKHSGVECSGVQFVISDVDRFDAIELGLTVARGLVHFHSKSWESQKLDVLVVNEEISKLIAAGTDYEEAPAHMEKELAEFKLRRAGVLLYD